MVLGAIQLGRRPPWLGRAFRAANLLQTWAMPDVFLLGLAVAFARLKASIDVEVGSGALAFIAVGVLALFTRATLDKGAVWAAILPDAGRAGPSTQEITLHELRLAGAGVRGRDPPAPAARPDSTPASPRRSGAPRR